MYAADDEAVQTDPDANSHKERDASSPRTRDLQGQQATPRTVGAYEISRGKNWISIDC